MSLQLVLILLVAVAVAYLAYRHSVVRMVLASAAILGVVAALAWLVYAYAPGWLFWSLVALALVFLVLRYENARWVLALLAVAAGLAVMVGILHAYMAPWAFWLLVLSTAVYLVLRSKLARWLLTLGAVLVVLVGGAMAVQKSMAQQVHTLHGLWGIELGTLRADLLAKKGKEPCAPGRGFAWRRFVDARSGDEWLRFCNDYDGEVLVVVARDSVRAIHVLASGRIPLPFGLSKDLLSRQTIEDKMGQRAAVDDREGGVVRNLLFAGDNVLFSLERDRIVSWAVTERE